MRNETALTEAGKQYAEAYAAHYTTKDLHKAIASSPLSVRELPAFTDIPVFSSAQPDTNGLAEVLIGSNKRSKRHEIAVQLIDSNG